MSKTPKIVSRRKTKNHQTELPDFKFSRNLIPSTADQGLLKYRQLAWESFLTIPFPSLREEAWRRTDIRGLHTDRFNLQAKRISFQEPPARYLNPRRSENEQAGIIVVSGGRNSQIINDALEEQGVIFVDFQTAEKNHPDLLNRLLGQIVTSDEDKFTALTAALASDGVFLYIPKNVVVEEPFHSLYWGEGEDKALLNHLIIWLEEGAQATFVHESASPQVDDDSQLLHSGIVEVHVGRNAKLNFIELQSWGNKVWSFTRERAQVMADGHLEWIFGAIGSHLTKNFSDIDLLEPGAVGRMSGFYFTSGKQHLDHDTQQNHMAENTSSDLMYKGALMDESRSVWQGMIYVAPGAIGTDGYQANRNLILSKGARADSIPGLEILADDVRCTHAATVGKIDPDEMFYLLSRGIPKQEAEELIVLGFFTPILERIPFESIRVRFREAVQEKMGKK